MPWKSEAEQMTIDELSYKIKIDKKTICNFIENNYEFYNRDIFVSEKMSWPRAMTTALAILMGYKYISAYSLFNKSLNNIERNLHE